MVQDNELVTDRSLCLLTNLTFLQLIHNLEVSNEGIILLTKLTYLDILDTRGIYEEGLIGMTNLKTLRLNYDTEIDLSQLSHISDLCIQYDEGETVPDSFFWNEQ
jgi:Leucine-rich repeat (LRR) protein